MPARPIVFFVFTNFVGPRRRVLEDPMVLCGFVALRCTVFHLGLEIDIETRMAAKCVNDLLTCCGVQLLPSNLRDGFVAECVPGVGRDHISGNNQDSDKGTLHYSNLSLKSLPS